MKNKLSQVLNENKKTITELKPTPNPSKRGKAYNYDKILSANTIQPYGTK